LTGGRVKNPQETARPDENHILLPANSGKQILRIRNNAVFLHPLNKVFSLIINELALTDRKTPTGLRINKKFH
jgi:hypothetical protein